MAGNYEICAGPERFVASRPGRCAISCAAFAYFAIAAWGRRFQNARNHEGDFDIKFCLAAMFVRDPTRCVMPAPDFLFAVFGLVSGHTRGVRAVQPQLCLFCLIGQLFGAALSCPFF